MNAQAVLVLDPGHGGEIVEGGSSPNRGVGPNGLLEKDVALDLARRAREMLRSDYSVTLTREDDRNLSLADRAAIARSAAADMFVSIHLSGSPDSTTSRTDVVIGRAAAPGTDSLAQEMQRQVSGVTGAPGALLRADLGQIVATRHHPRTKACLIEVADVTNAVQASRLRDPVYLDRLATALAAAIRSGAASPIDARATQLSVPIGRGMSVADVADQVVASGEATPAEVEDFLQELQQSRNPLAAKSSAHTLSEPVTLPGALILTGWKAEIFAAMLGTITSTVVPGSFFVPSLLLEAADRMGCTFMIGPAAGATAVVGVTGSFGVVLAPGRRIGFYGSIGAVGGWSIGVEVTVRVTALKGGPEHCSDSVVLAIGAEYEGIAGGITLLLSPATNEIEGVSFEIGVGVGLTPISGVIGRELTVTTFSLGRQWALPLSGPLADWERLISFRPPSWVQRKLKDEHDPDWNPHRIENANGPINLDYYPVTVSSLPSFAATPEALLERMRLDLNSVVDTTKAQFAAYDAANATVWTSPTPVGAVVHIDMLAWAGWVNPDDGSVVCAEAAPDHWVFSTIWTIGDGDHPVSGNREWGFTPNSDGTCTFYTRGADRPTGLVDDAMQSTIFSSADALWRSWQAGLFRLVTAGGGTATAGSPVSARYDWDATAATYWHPTVGWEPWW